MAVKKNHLSSISASISVACSTKQAQVAWWVGQFVSNSITVIQSLYLVFETCFFVQHQSEMYLFIYFVVVILLLSVHVTNSFTTSHVSRLQIFERPLFFCFSFVSLEVIWRPPAELRPRDLNKSIFLLKLYFNKVSRLNGRGFAKYKYKCSHLLTWLICFFYFSAYIFDLGAD